VAVLGLTELQAVNRMLRAINQNPVPALVGTGDSSIQGRAQEVLEETLITKLIAGLEENTISTTLNLDRSVTAGTLTAISASATPVVTTSSAHGLSITAGAPAVGIVFFSANAYPYVNSPNGPYTIVTASASSITLTSGQVTTTAAATSGSWHTLSKITVPSNTLRIIGTGSDSYRTFHFDSTNNVLIDIDRAGTQYFEYPVNVKLIFNPGTFGSGSTASTAFENLTPASKEAITNEAAMIFQRRFRGSPEQDGWLEGERVKTEVVVPKPLQNRSDSPVNMVPVTMVPPPQRTQE